MQHRAHGQQSGIAGEFAYVLLEPLCVPRNADEDTGEVVVAADLLEELPHVAVFAAVASEPHLHRPSKRVVQKRRTGISETRALFLADRTKLKFGVNPLNQAEVAIGRVRKAILNLFFIVGCALGGAEPCHVNVHQSIRKVIAPFAAQGAPRQAKADGPEGCSCSRRLWLAEVAWNAVVEIQFYGLQVGLGDLLDFDEHDVALLVLVSPVGRVTTDVQNLPVLRISNGGVVRPYRADQNSIDFEGVAAGAVRHRQYDVRCDQAGCAMKVGEARGREK